MRRPKILTALVLIPAAAAAQAHQTIVTADKLEIHGCDEIAYYPPGKLQRFEGVFYSWFDNNGFVPCASARECKRFMELGKLGIRASDDGWVQIHDWQHRYGQNFGTYRIRFIGRRGTMNVPGHCLDHTLPDVPAYVRVEKVLSMEPLEKERP